MAKIERTKNAVNNMVFGTVLKVYQLIGPFLMRTAMIYFMGEQYLGLSSLFTATLQVLNLAELGVGSAMVFSMYKPIAEDDTAAICALMKLYRLYYRVIGLVIAVAGCALVPFVPRLIKGEVPDGINVYVLYLFHLAATVFSYWLFAYKNSIFAAHQRTDVGSKVSLVTSTLQFGLQFVALWLLRDYYAYTLIALGIQVVTNLVTAFLADKLYPNYKPSGTLPKEQVDAINRRIRDLFTSKLGGIIVNSADTIVISAFLGLTVLAVYQNYFYLLTAIIGFVSIIFSACTAGIGNSLIVESQEKNFNDLKKLTFIIAWIAGFCSCCFLNLYQPFMEIWAGNRLMLEYAAVICFVVYYFIFEINQLLNLYKDAAGIWHADRFRPLATAIANLTMNLVMVQFWGIYGVLLSTVLSMLFVGMPWLFHNLFTTIFDRKQLPAYLGKVLLYTAVSFLVCAVSVFICSYISWGKWPTLIIRLIVCMILPNVLFCIIYHGMKEYRESLALANSITKGKFAGLLTKLGMKP